MKISVKKEQVQWRSHCRSFGRLGTSLAVSGRRQTFQFRCSNLITAVPLHTFRDTECGGQGNEFELIPILKIETRHSVEIQFGRENAAICYHCGVMVITNVSHNAVICNRSQAIVTPYCC